MAAASYFAVVHVDGLVGVFSSPGSARAALLPYIERGWRGMILPFRGGGSGDDANIDSDDGSGSGNDANINDVLVLMPREGDCRPFAVGPAEYVRAERARLEDSGLVESADDLEFHKAPVDAIIPHVKLLLDTLLVDEERAAQLGDALGMFLAKVHGDIAQSAAECETPEQVQRRRLPLLGDMMGVASAIGGPADEQTEAAGSGGADDVGAATEAEAAEAAADVGVAAATESEAAEAEGSDSAPSPRLPTPPQPPHEEAQKIEGALAEAMA